MKYNGIRCTASLAVAAPGASPEYFNLDLKTFGFIFECLCIRDLRIYSFAHGGQMSYYHDRQWIGSRWGFASCEGRYALLEFKLESKEIEEGAKHLCEIESLIGQHNEKEYQSPIRIPDLKIVVTGGRYGYKRPDGVFVIPIGFLKD